MAGTNHDARGTIFEGWPRRDVEDAFRFVARLILLGVDATEAGRQIAERFDGMPSECIVRGLAAAVPRARQERLVREVRRRWLRGSCRDSDSNPG